MINWSNKSPNNGGFNRDLLEEPHVFYHRHLSKLGQENSDGWAKAICPFHADHNPSFSVNLNSGAYKCFSCGESGGDIISFYMRSNRVDFITACKELGAWGDNYDQ